MLRTREWVRKRDISRVTEANWPRAIHEAGGLTINALVRRPNVFDESVQAADDLGGFFVPVPVRKFWAVVNPDTLVRWVIWVRGEDRRIACRTNRARTLGENVRHGRTDQTTRQKRSNGCRLAKGGDLLSEPNSSWFFSASTNLRRVPISLKHCPVFSRSVRLPALLSDAFTSNLSIDDLSKSEVASWPLTSAARLVGQTVRITLTSCKADST